MSKSTTTTSGKVHSSTFLDATISEELEIMSGFEQLGRDIVHKSTALVGTLTILTVLWTEGGADAL